MHTTPPHRIAAAHAPNIRAIRNVTLVLLFSTVALIVLFDLSKDLKQPQPYCWEGLQWKEVDGTPMQVTDLAGNQLLCRNRKK